MASDGKQIEIIYVGYEQTVASFVSYVKQRQVPWLVLPYQDQHGKTLARYFNVTSVPHLVILETGVKGQTKLVSNSGVEFVKKVGVNAFIDTIKTYE